MDYLSTLLNNSLAHVYIHNYSPEEMIYFVVVILLFAVFAFMAESGNEGLKKIGGVGIVLLFIVPVCIAVAMSFAKH